MKKHSGQIISIACCSIIILRLIFPQFSFDNTSLILFGIAIIGFIIPNPDLLFNRAKKIKIWDFEIELDKLNRETEKIERRIREKELKTPSISGLENSQNKRFRKRIQNETIENSDLNFAFSDNLHTDILKISIEIEKILRVIYETNLDTKHDRPLSVYLLIKELKKNEIIDSEIMTLLNEFWSFRNQIVHSTTRVTTEEELLSFTDIGLRIIKILNVLQNNLISGTTRITILQ